MCQYLVVQYIIADASSATVLLDTSTYVWCFIWYSTTRYWHIFLMFHRVLYNKILPVYGCAVYDEASEILVIILWYSTWIKISNMCQYLVVLYMKKHKKYVPVSLCTYFWCFSMYCAPKYWHIFLMLHDSDDSSHTVNPDTATHFGCFIVYFTTIYWSIFLMFIHVLCT
jgi:hypothetical protein